MKKIWLVLLSLLAIAAATFGACEQDGSAGNGKENVTGQEKETIEGVTFASDGFVYDGQEKTVTVSGELPAGVSVSYTNNKQTNAGEYEATAVLSGEGYETLTLRTTWKIDKAQITGITLAAEQETDADGAYHLPQYTGELPAGVTATWYFDGAPVTSGVKTHGTYALTLVLSGSNYVEQRLTTQFRLKQTIAEIQAVAKEIVDAFKQTPKPWDFLPEKFQPQHKLLTEGQIAAFVTGDKEGEEKNAYASFVNVSNIPVNYIGKQMNVVYGVLNKTQTALGYVQKVQAGLAAVETAYVEYILKNPEGYSKFEDTEGSFTYCIETSEKNYTLSVNAGGVGVLIFADKTDEENPAYGARIQLTQNTVLKYDMEGEEHLKIALVVADTAATQVEFLKKDGNTAGYIYEYLFAADKQIVATSALLTVGDNYTTVIGTKGDFIPTSGGRNCEVYSNATGYLVGTEVKETLDKKDYDTLWFNLRDLQGITLIRKEDKANKVNADTIWINGYNTDTLHSATVNLITDLSRRFDIEFKTVYAWKATTNADGIVEYEKAEFEIPMLFVQRKCLDTFEADFAEKNSDALGGKSVTLTGSAQAQAAVAYGYTQLLPVYETVKENVTYDEIKKYCGIFSAED